MLQSAEKQLNLTRGPGKIYIYIKRTIDLLGALLGLVLFLPLMLIIGLLIKLEHPSGSVFYKQIRYGKAQRTFYMYKFRTMVTNADELFEELRAYNEIQGKMFKMKQDPRITRVGCWLRKTSLDELPQLWNVILGDMSLVGPRPPLPREVEEYTEYEKLRLSVIPGCTGLWQVSGRNHLGFHDMVRLDLYYIENRSLLLDIHILLKTVPAMFGREDAY